jgi:uncharacterized membrane protein
MSIVDNAKQKAGPTDQQMDNAIAGMLRLGVALSAFFVIFGGALFLRHPWSPAPSYASFHGTPAPLRSVRGVLGGVRSLRAQSIIQLGVLLLILTPIARVGLCVVDFARQRDRLYVAVSCAVLAVLIYSILHGAG